MSEPTTASTAYVYGIVRAGSADAIGDLSGVGDPPRRIDAVPHEGIAALWSAVDGSVREARREDLLAHARALETVSERTAVLPMRFGMTMPSAEAIVDELLAPYHDRWDALLDEFGDAIELRVKAFHDQDALLRQIVAEDPEVRALRGSEDMSDRIRLGERVSGALERRRQADASWLLERLRPLARDVRELELSLESMVLDAAFLVDRDGAVTFDREVATMADEAAERLRLRCLGPQPAYTFVNQTAEG